MLLLNELAMKKRQAGIGERARGKRVSFDAIAVALIGEVEERQQVALAQQRDQLLPLRARQVDAGRVVTARVQEHDAARGQPRNASHIASNFKPPVAAS